MEKSDPIPAFIERVTALERAWPITRDQAEAIATARLTDAEVAALIAVLSRPNALPLATILRQMQRAKAQQAMAQRPARVIHHRRR